MAERFNRVLAEATPPRSLNRAYQSGIDTIGLTNRDDYVEEEDLDTAHHEELLCPVYADEIEDGDEHVDEDYEEEDDEEEDDEEEEENGERR